MESFWNDNTELYHLGLMQAVYLFYEEIADWLEK